MSREPRFRAPPLSLRETMRREPVRVVPKPINPFLRAVIRRIEAERAERLAVIPPAQAENPQRAKRAR